AEGRQHVAQLFDIRAGDREIEVALGNALVEQLGDVALEIVHGAPHLHGLAVADMARMHEVGAAVKDEGLQRHAELAAVINDLHVRVRNAARASIEPQPVVEPTLLRRAAYLGKTVAAPQRQAAAAQALRRFEDDAIVAGTVELESRAQAGDPGAENGDGPARPRILRQGEARGPGAGGLQEIPGGQRLVRGPCPAQPRHGADELASRDRQGGLPSSAAQDGKRRRQNYNGRAVPGHESRRVAGYFMAITDGAGSPSPLPLMPLSP